MKTRKFPFLVETRRPIVLAILALCFLVACEADDFKNSGKKEDKGNISKPQAAGAESADVAVARVIYDMKVKANTGLELCAGVAEFIMMQNFKLNPSGTLQCLIGGNVDLGKMFGNPSLKLKTEDMGQYKDYGKVVRVQNPVTLEPGAEEFTPPKPGFLGPIVQDVADFKDFTFREKSQVRGISKTGEAYQASGEWYIRVHEVGGKLEPEGYTGPLKFENIMRWEIKAVEFENAPKADFMGFESTMYWYNTRPQISIPKIEIKSRLSDVAGNINPQGGGVMGTLGDLLFAGVTITLTVREHTPL